MKEPTLSTIQKQLEKGFERMDADFIKQGKQLEKLTEEINKKPDRDEFPELLEKMFAFITLKAEHDRMKKIIQEKLGVEV